MVENSKIEWTDHTVNFWIGCTKVSPACHNCYAENQFGKRFGIKWGKGQPRKQTKREALLKKVLAWDRKAAKTGILPKVFCNSLSDFFDDDHGVSDEWRDWAMSLMARTPNLNYLVLTKRAEKMHKYSVEARACGQHWLANVTSDIVDPWPLPNVWLGVTVENQKTANERIPLLLDTPAAKRFISMEPLLGPVDLSDWMGLVAGASRHTRSNEEFERCDLTGNPMTGLDWVIAGGESGPKARPSAPDWFRGVRDDCTAAGVPYLHKQNGEWVGYGASCLPVGGNYGLPKEPTDSFTFEDGTTVFRVGKKAAGRLLDGELHAGRPDGKNGPSEETATQ